MTELEVQLTADIKRLESQLSKAESRLKGFGATADKQGRIAQRGFTNAGKGAANAVPTLQEFSRVIQDAPFGIQGVANNITQLTSNFQNLSKSAGGSGAAIRLLLKEFIGPAGILFAVSAITSLLVTYGDKLFQSTNKTKELANATKSFAGSARSEISVLQTLLGIASDETQSRQRRNEAVQVLQNKYPKYLSNLNAENTTTKNIKRAVDDLTKAIENRARVQGAEALIQQKAEELFLKQEKAQQAYKKAIDNIPTSLERARQANQSYARGVGATSQQIFDIQKNEERLRSIANQRLSNSLGEAEKEYQEYVNNLKQILSGVPSLLSAFNTTVTEDIKSFRPGINQNPFKNFIQPDLLSGQAKIAFQNLSKVLASDGPTIIAPQLSNIEQRFADFKNRLATSTLDLASSVSSGFSQLGSALAQGAGLFDAVGSAILQTMGSIATQLGQAAIAAGIAGLALKNLFKSPIGAIVAGGALVAIGAALSSARSAVGSIGGGNVGGQGSAGGPSFSGATVSTGGGFNGRVVFEISGQKLIGVLNNSLSANQRLGGNVSLG